MSPGIPIDIDRYRPPLSERARARLASPKSKVANQNPAHRASASMAFCIRMAAYQSGAPGNSQSMFLRRFWAPYGQRAPGARIGRIFYAMGAKKRQIPNPLYAQPVRVPFATMASGVGISPSGVDVSGARLADIIYERSAVSVVPISPFRRRRGGRLFTLLDDAAA